MFAVAVALVNGEILGRGYPHNSFLFLPEDRFADYTNIIRYQRTGDPYASPYMVYFPFTNAVLWPLARLSDRVGLLLTLLLLATTVVALGLAATRRMPFLSMRAAAVAALLVSYPVVFAADRANVEIMVFAFFALFAWALASGRREIAAVALSGAIGMKASPVVFAGLFLRKGERRYLALTATLVVAETFVGLVILRPSITRSIEQFRDALTFYNDTYVGGDAGYAFGHSAFGAVRAVVTFFGGTSARHAFSGDFEPVAVGFAAIGLVATAVALAFCRGPLWARLAFATAALLLLTPVSADYRLLLMLVPMSIFLATAGPFAGQRLLPMCFGLLLIPKAVDWSFGRWWPGLGVAFSAVTTAAILAAVLVLSLRVALTAGDSQPPPRRLRRRANPAPAPRRRAPEPQESPLPS